MNLNQIDIRQLTQFAGKVLIGIGLAMFFFNLNIGLEMFRHSGLEIAVAGFLLKAI
ncbi:ethanolamine utilization protein EutD [Hyphomicrobium sp. MC1]|uniref:ethanolamine utilization protein EutD n=1 Tax=Hyphomicrobium sp. (strain MC1) TaxID=717785 RepID=UPI000213DAA5|nr:ethanolamine utilization protein EutD [Hyphomicrobium sp. MC1]CCB64458.1 Excision repair cross-complementing rodent repair deficiency, complementation group 4-like protein [Hyphomicrobium sp. MC1]